MKIITEIIRVVAPPIGAVVMAVALVIFVTVVVPAILGAAAIVLGVSKAVRALHLTNRKPETAP